jgi:CRISPR-associated protein Cst1
LLKYTDHPFVDVGAATIAAFAEKRRPEEVTVEDLERLAPYLEEQYQRKYLTGYLTCIFPNSAYVNPTSGTEKKRAFIDQHLYNFRDTAPEDSENCGICGEPATGRGFRQHVPMVTGEGVLNFFPSAQPGLSLCPGCMISIAALPLGALRCGGRALIVHADDPELTYHFARKHLERNESLLHLQNLAPDAKFPDAKQVRTRLIDELRGWTAEEARRSQKAARGRLRPVSLTAYHLTNSGQGPDLDIYHLPAPILTFLLSAEAEPYRETWREIIREAWRLNEKDKDDTTTYRNFLFDDIFRLPDQWPAFMRTYFLRRAYRAAPKDDPRGSYGPGRDLALISWPLTELFLKEVIGMQEHRVKAIRDFGDRVANYIAERDPGFWRDFHMAKTYGGLRVRLIRASQAERAAGRPLLIGFDDFITIFEYGEELARPDWRLARDLVLIRVIEQLHARQWFAEHPEALNLETPDEDTSEETVAAAAEEE